MWIYHLPIHKLIAKKLFSQPVTLSLDWTGCLHQQWNHIFMDTSVLQWEEIWKKGENSTEVCIKWVRNVSTTLFSALWKIPKIRITFHFAAFFIIGFEKWETKVSISISVVIYIEEYNILKALILTIRQMNKARLIVTIKICY